MPTDNVVNALLRVIANSPHPPYPGEANTPYWQLRLKCGHIAFAHVQYSSRKTLRRQGGKGILPAPFYIDCPQCKREKEKKMHPQSRQISFPIVSEEVVNKVSQMDIDAVERFMGNDIYLQLFIFSQMLPLLRSNEEIYGIFFRLIRQMYAMLYLQAKEDGDKLAVIPGDEYIAAFMAESENKEFKNAIALLENLKIKNPNLSTWMIREFKTSDEVATNRGLLMAVQAYLMLEEQYQFIAPGDKH